MERKPLTRRERIGKYYYELIAQDRVGFPPEKETYILVVFLCFLCLYRCKSSLWANNLGELYAVSWGLACGKLSNA